MGLCCLERVQASRRAANMNEAQMERRRATQPRGQLTVLDKLEKMCPAKLRFY